MGTYRMRDLVQAAGVTRRIVRSYIQRGILPPAEGRGTGALYTEEHLIRLRAARRLLEQRVPLAAIGPRLARLSPQELARLGAPDPAAPPAAAPTPPAAPPQAAATPAATFPAAERWERLALLPGLELHVRADAGPLVRRLAGEIHARYSAEPPPSPGAPSAGEAPAPARDTSTPT